MYDYEYYRDRIADNKEKKRLEGLSHDRHGKRKRHSHRCKRCGVAMLCHKGRCVEPQRIDRCGWC